MIDEFENIEALKNRAKRKYLIFRLGPKRYSLPLNKVKEVLGVTEITEIPNVPSFYKGLINLRGQIISVIDLRIKFGLDDIAIVPKQSSIIISMVGEVLIGSVVDEVIEVVGYEDSQIDTNETQRMERCGDGVYAAAKDDDGNITLLLDIEKSLNSTEFNMLQQKNAG